MAIENVDIACSFCGAHNPDGAVFCGRCGRSFQANTGKVTIQFPPNTSAGALPVFPVAPAKPFWTQRKIIIFSATVIMLLLFIGAGLFALAYQLGRNSVQTGTSPFGNTPGNSGTSPVNNTANTVTAGTTTPTTNSTSASSLTPTTVPKAGTILYLQDGSDGWQGWALTTDWKIVENNKLLINDGSVGRNHQGPSAIPPFTLPPGVQNFAIEASITIPQIPSDAHFGISACGSTTASGWQGYEGIIAFGYGGGNPTAQVWRYGDAQLANVAFDPGTRTHTYRLEVRGNVINLFIDHARVIQTTDDKFLTCGSQVGMWSSVSIIQVSSFKVIAL